jgi:DNA-binding IclR family transcriptional regulator
VFIPKVNSKVIGRALGILDFFSDPDTNPNLTELVQLSGIPEASLFRVLLMVLLQKRALRPQE